MSCVVAQTVQDWRLQGYRGLRIPRCPGCGCGTERTWEELRASPCEDVIEAARRVRCQDCGQVPAGLTVIAYRAADPLAGAW
jgi:hypothetical protein